MNDSSHLDLDPQTVAALSGGPLALEDVDRWLDELAAAPYAATGGSVPADFSRADVYRDHD